MSFWLDKSMFYHRATLLSAKKRLALSAAVCTLIISGWWFLLYRPMMIAVHPQVSTFENKQKRITDLQGSVFNSGVNADFNHNKQHALIWQEGRWAENLDLLVALLDKYKLTCKKMGAIKQAIRSYKSKKKLTFGLLGKYENMVNFLDAVNHELPHVKVSSLTLNRSNKSNMQAILQLSMLGVK